MLPGSVQPLAHLGIRGDPPGPDAGDGVARTLAAVCPYRGLLYFREEDAPFFCGREAAITGLVEAVGRGPLVAVVGASGCGKSSVVWAGLVPALRRDGARGWDIVTIVPGARPLHALAAGLLPLLEPEMGEVRPAGPFILPRRSAMKRPAAVLITLIACITLSLVVAGGPRSLPAALIWEGTSVDGLIDNRRAPVADIADMSPTHFAIGYVSPSGRPLYAYYDTRAGQQVAPFGDGGQASWVRANTSKYLSKAKSGCLAPGKGTLYTNYFAAQVDGGEVYLDRHSHCQGAWKPWGYTWIASGAYRPSVATRGSLDTGSALVVYGQANQLLGRFYYWGAGRDQFPISPLPAEAGLSDLPGRGLSGPFLIQQLPAGASVFSTDVIYNLHSRSFIVGYIERKPADFCRIKNIVLSDAPWPPTVEVPTHFGDCDSDQGGHHTSVAYNPLGDGTYTWWRPSNTDGKAVFIHDRNGQFTGSAFSTNLNAWTAPVTRTNSSTTPYIALAYQDSILSLWGQPRRGAWSRLEGLTLGQHQVAVRTLSTQTVALTEYRGSLLLYLSDVP